MRIWSLHPQYLDTKGLVAVWRETLLAQKVLQGLTKGYRNHSQLIRFSSHPNPLQAIGFYLHHIQAEGTKRGYKFDYSKIIFAPQNVEESQVVKIKVNSEQVKYEFLWLLSKLKKRDTELYETFNKPIESHNAISIHPLFDVSVGDIEHWEKVVPDLIEKSKESNSKKTEAKEKTTVVKPKAKRAVSQVQENGGDSIKKRLRKR